MFTLKKIEFFFKIKNSLDNILWELYKIKGVWSFKRFKEKKFFFFKFKTIESACKIFQSLLTVLGVEKIDWVFWISPKLLIFIEFFSIKLDCGKIISTKFNKFELPWDPWKIFKLNIFNFRNSKLKTWKISEAL